MKKIVYILLFACAVVSARPQGIVYTVVEEMPQFPGGPNEMMSFIQKNIKYPEALMLASIGGKVFIKFVVDSTGAVSKINIIRSSGFSSMDNEALSVVSKMPQWTPGKQNGKTVSVYFNLPISFAPDGPYFVKSVLNSNPNYNAAIKKLEVQDKEGALALLDKALEENPNDGDALYNKSMIFLSKKDIQKGCEVLNLAVAAKNPYAEKAITKYCNK